MTNVVDLSTNSWKRTVRSVEKKYGFGGALELFADGYTGDSEYRSFAALIVKSTIAYDYLGNGGGDGMNSVYTATLRLIDASWDLFHNYVKDKSKEAVKFSDEENDYKEIVSIEISKAQSVRDKRAHLARIEDVWDGLWVNLLDLHDELIQYLSGKFSELSKLGFEFYRFRFDDNGSVRIGMFKDDVLIYVIVHYNRIGVHATVRSIEI